MSVDSLLDGHCYLIDISQAVAYRRGENVYLIGGDGDCGIRMLAGDVNQDATVTVTDVNDVTAQVGHTIDATTCRYDVNVDGSINSDSTGDVDFVTARLDNALSCSGGGGSMMMAAGTSGAMVAAEGSTSEQLLTAIDGEAAAGASVLANSRAVRRESSTARPNVLALVRQQRQASRQPLAGQPTLIREQAASAFLPEATVAQDVPVEAVSPVHANVAFAVHGTGGVSVTVPATGGRIVVDVVITTDGPITAFDGRPAIDATGAASLDATSSYAPDVMLSLPNVNEAGELVSPEPISMALEISAAAGPLDRPSGTAVTARATIGGLIAVPLAAGSTTVATLTLDVAGVPGEYHLTFADALAFDPDSLRVAMTGEPLTIVVGEP